MGQRPDTLEREIVASRERMSQTIDQMERELRRSMDWKSRVQANPVPYVVGGLVVAYLLVGGPRRTAAMLRSRRPRPKTRFEKLVEQLPEPLAERIAPPLHDAVINLQELPENLRKTVREAQRERDRQVQKEEEERLRKAARATMWERVLVKVAEAAGTALAAALVKTLTQKLLKEEES